MYGRVLRKGTFEAHQSLHHPLLNDASPLDNCPPERVLFFRGHFFKRRSRRIYDVRGILPPGNELRSRANGVIGSYLCILVCSITDVIKRHSGKAFCHHFLPGWLEKKEGEDSMPCNERMAFWMPAWPLVVLLLCMLCAQSVLGLGIWDKDMFRPDPEGSLCPGAHLEGCALNDELSKE